MLQKDKIRKMLSKPISRISIIAVLFLIFLGWAGLFYLRYQQAVSRFYPEFEALKSMTEGQNVRIVNLQREIFQCKEKLKEIEVIKKRLEEQFKQIFNLSEDIVVNPETGKQIYTNKFWGFEVSIPASWYHVYSSVKTEAEKENQERKYPEKSVLAGSVDFSSQAIKSPLELDKNGFYLKIEVFEDSPKLSLLEWISKITARKDIIISESETEIAGQKTLLRLFDTSVSPPINGDGFIYGMKTFVKKDYLFLTILIFSRTQQEWEVNHGENIFLNIIRTFHFLK